MKPLPHRVRAGARAWIIGAGGTALLVCAVWCGCTVTPKNYKTLSFFFDGVPDPSAPVAGAEASADSLRRSPTYVAHKPYAEERCDECHASRYRLTRNSSDVCMKCHAPVRTQYDRMHGPVAAGACLWCHSPHESAYPSLLRDQDRKVCSQCHSPSMLDSQRTPAHADEGRSCLECHFGHGGERDLFLRPAARAAVEGAPNTK